MTLDLHAARALPSRPAVSRLLAILDREGEETRIVGGAVRNALIGRPVQDVDLATTALPAETTRRAEAAGFRAVPTGIAHGTVTVLVGNEPFEVTTLREDVDTDGRHATVRFGRDFAADARRRDFTVNALSLGRDGAIHDATGGLADLWARRIRFIGDPEARIREDYLRVLRFFRFHAEYALGPPDPAGLLACIAGREGLRRLSRERVRAELLKLLAAPGGADAAAALEGAGLLGRLVSCLGDAGRLRRARGLDPTGRLSAFLVRTREDAGRLRDDLRLANAEAARLEDYAAALARALSRSGPIDAREANRLAVLHGARAAADVLAATAGEPRPVVTADARARIEAFASGEADLPRLPLTGADIVAGGVPPGPEVGRRLAAARAAWLEAGCPLALAPEAALGPPQAWC